MCKKAGILLVLALTAALVSFAQDGNYASSSVLNEEIAFTFEEFKQGKNEGIYFMSRFNDGWVVMINLFHIKTNVFNKWGIYILVCEPDGETHWETFEMDPKKVYIDTDRLYVSDGKNTIQGGNDIYYVDINLSTIQASLTFTNILESWKAGNGVDYLSLDKNQYMKRILSSPWAVVGGSLVIGKNQITVRGVGYGEKSLIISPLTKQNPYLHAFRVFTETGVSQDSRWFIGLLDTQSHESFGALRLPRLNVAKGDDWIFSTNNYTLTPMDFFSPPDMPYSYPRRIQLYSKTGGYELNGEYRTGVLFNVTDVINEIPAIIRPLVLLFLKRPIYFRFLGEFDGWIRYPDGTFETLKLFGPYEYVIVR